MPPLQFIHRPRPLPTALLPLALLPLAPAAAAEPALTPDPPAVPAATTAVSAPAAQPAAPPREEAPARWTPFASLRLRQEVWGWFQSPGLEDTYTFSASSLRLGAVRRSGSDTIWLEVQAAGLADLPHRASGLPPVGQLGHGSSYFDANAGQDATLFVKQAYWQGEAVGGPANRLRLGRFEFSDGAEAPPSDPTLAWLRGQRIAQRLIGPFGFTHVGRSFDALELTRKTRRTTLTLFGGIPTRGVFDLNGMDTIPDVRVGYLSLTRPVRGGGAVGDARLFGVYYDDTRDRVVKADNRPAARRAADADDIRIGTVGGHALAAWELPPGRLDALLWGGGQFGRWGRQSHRAYALAAEAGFQPRGFPGSPWFRVGFQRASGDGDASDGVHGTWMPLLPSPRGYARFPFFTEMNRDDAFAQVVIRPSPRLTLRPEVHFLSLADEADLWYSGGGAFQDRPAFGTGGRPGGGHRYLGTLLDLSVDYQLRKDTGLSLYFGHVRGGGVVGATYPGRDGWFGYLELVRRF